MIDPNTIVPRYINEAFTLPDKSGNLPIGVREVYGCYIPIMFRGDNWEPDLRSIFKTPHEAHEVFQQQYAVALRVCNQYFNFSDHFNKDISKGLRLQAEKIENDLSAGRETVSL
ncbi:MULTISPECIES: hypothetical protein [Halomonadaceae]|uniref:hypothetical protein n=1 Tax=Halomonadaceae TaxID=28256 RepID=UPI001583E509|nr:MULTISPECIES: hypothetical protein [Halomonas]MDI4637508.1 hypothetical protein [Halomonas sp. BMC7]NUJ61342.1 hypothetical protein [Halomonas taeanensis]